MNERVLLVAPDSNLRPHLASSGFQTISWPQLRLAPLQNPAALDEAIENLYGYDWIIFIHTDAVRFFLERLELRSGDVSDLDSLRVCAIGEVAATVIEQGQIHVDVVTRETDSSAILEQLSVYIGGVEHLDRLSFLLPQAAIGRDYLKDQIESLGARVDVVNAYQTVANVDLTRLTGLQSMLLTNSVDAVVFSSPAEVSELARVFDKNNLDALLRNVLVVTTDDATANAVRVAGISESMQLNEPSLNSIVESLGTRFGG